MQINNTAYIDEVGRRTQIYVKFDVVVAGGGLGGVAAKAGASVLLVEGYSCLGGMLLPVWKLPFVVFSWMKRERLSRKVLLWIFKQTGAIGSSP